MIERYILVGIFAFFAGCFMMLGVWESAAERGLFEVGSKIYKAHRVDLRTQP